MAITGGCHCGKVRYVIEQEALLSPTAIAPSVEEPREGGALRGPRCQRHRFSGKPLSRESTNPPPQGTGKES